MRRYIDEDAGKRRGKRCMRLVFDDRRERLAIPLVEVSAVLALVR